MKYKEILKLVKVKVSGLKTSLCMHTHAHTHTVTHTLTPTHTLTHPHTHTHTHPHTHIHTQTPLPIHALIHILEEAIFFKLSYINQYII